MTAYPPPLNQSSSAFLSYGLHKWVSNRPETAMRGTAILARLLLCHQGFPFPTNFHTSISISDQFSRIKLILTFYVCFLYFSSFMFCLILYHMWSSGHE